MSAVIEHEKHDIQQAPTPSENPMMEMVREAMRSGQSIDVIREVRALAKEMAEDEAQRAFNVAFANFKAEVIEVRRNRQVNDGPLRGRKYAELVSFVDAATPALSKQGLSASWSITRDEKDWIEVTCTIEHALGGKKQVSFGGPPDSGGAKNALQARISTVTYLERVTFKAACGLAEQGDDDDGAGGRDEVAPISKQQVEVILGLIESSGTDIQRFCQTYKINAVPELRTSDFQAALGNLNRKLARKQSEASHA